VPLFNDLYLLERLGCGLRLAMKNVPKEELPHELGRLLSRLAQLQPTLDDDRGRSPTGPSTRSHWKVSHNGNVC